MKTVKKLLILIALAICLLSTLISCKKNPGSENAPEIKPNSQLTQITEDIPNNVADVTVILTNKSNKIVTVDYSTSDSTAIAGTDYVAIASGNLTFQAGELSKAIKVTVIPNADRKEDVYFKIVLTNPVNAKLPASEIKIKILNVDYANLAWSDEFNTGTLNQADWNYELGGGGWGNNELETYTNSVSNAHIDTGYLHITALNPSASLYTSSRLTTKGKKEFTYFRVDIRARLPEGKGIWPALWTLGGNISSAGWPKCGEIDIMELLGHEPAKAYGTLHWDATGHQSRGSNFTLPVGKFSDSFHVFSLIWTPNKMKWLIDNQIYFTANKAETTGFPFDLPQFFIFNVAVGGNWPGSPDQSTVFPQHMIVDYIRVYQ